VQALADADERDVLAAWSGLGYYRRARSLHGAAKMIVAEHGGRFPGDPTTILELPGVGRYTAGAIASLAFGLAEPIVDGNVARVLLRLHGREAASDDREVQGWLWERAGALVRAAAAPGVVNEAIMELGATVCTPPPSIPRCERCPLRNRCIARIEGRQLEIPRPKTRPVRTVLHCAVAVVERSDSSLLIEQRPTEGLWGAMWQAPTLESADSTPTAANLGAALGLDPRLLRPDAVFEHGTTHRRVLFRVWRAAGPASFVPRRGLWMPLVRIEALGLSNPQRRILLESARGGTLFT
jgi:A/G-specific adenine glycosylase